MSYLSLSKTSEHKQQKANEYASSKKPHHAQPSRLELGILTLQHTIGNQAVTHLLQQGKSSSSSSTSKMSCTDALPMQRAAENVSPMNGVSPIVHNVLNSSGQPLDLSTRSTMESRFGHDFSGVRVHTDAQAVASARALSARAYTIGQNIVFGEGLYTPGVGDGQRLLAHELAHVIQQERGGTTPPSLIPGNSLEQEAHLASKAVTQGQDRIQVAGASAPGLARETDEEREKRLRSEALSYSSKMPKSGASLFERFPSLQIDPSWMQGEQSAAQPASTPAESKTRLKGEAISHTSWMPKAGGGHIEHFPPAHQIPVFVPGTAPQPGSDEWTKWFRETAAEERQVKPADPPLAKREESGRGGISILGSLIPSHMTGMLRPQVAAGLAQYPALQQFHAEATREAQTGALHFYLAAGAAESTIPALAAAYSIATPVAAAGYEAIAASVPPGALAAKGGTAAIGATAATYYSSGTTLVTGSATVGGSTVAYVAQNPGLMNYAQQAAPRFATVTNQLANNPSLLSGSLSPNLLAAAVRNPRLADIVYGKGVEVLAQGQTPNLVQRLGGAFQPDAIVKVGNQLVYIDWTTLGQLEEHLARSYYQAGPFIIFLHQGRPTPTWPF